MIFTFAPPSNKTFSIVFFPICTLITTIWLSTSITIILTSECILILVVTLCFNIILIAIIGFFGFIFCHIYIFKSGVIFNNWPNLKVWVVFKNCLLIPWNILEYLFHIYNLLLGITNKFCGTIGFVDTLIFSNHA